MDEQLHQFRCDLLPQYLTFVNGLIIPFRSEVNGLLRRMRPY
jgi:hypothetical protein